jgi:hypothetical protein
MLRYFTSIFLFISALSIAQTTVPADSLATTNNSIEKKYGLRVGIDMASLIRTAIDDEYSGFQILADFRLTNKLYLAAELGNENLDATTDRIDYETSGSFFKGGVDYNFYQNWLDMDNMIYGGVRLGYANMTQTLNRFEYNTNNTYFTEPSIFETREFTGLSTLWLEIQLGIKVEVLNNLYLIANVQLKRLITESQPDNFDNLYVPGFGRTYDTGEIGAGYSYGIMYRVPLFKR